MSQSFFHPGQNGSLLDSISFHQFKLTTQVKIIRRSVKLSFAMWLWQRGNTLQLRSRTMAEKREQTQGGGNMELLAVGPNSLKLQQLCSFCFPLSGCDGAMGWRYRHGRLAGAAYDRFKPISPSISGSRYSKEDTLQGFRSKVEMNLHPASAGKRGSKPSGASSRGQRGY